MASEKVNALIEEIKAMSVLELSELVHEIEDVFGVSAASKTSSAFPPLLLLPPLRLPALLLPPSKRRPSLTLS